jgi:hypothetical protein
MALRPDLAGRRVKGVNEPAIYLIDDDGTRRWITDPTTFNSLFRNWDGIEEFADINAIDRGADINGAILAKDPNLAPVFLIDLGHKRWITSPQVMDKFNFSWDTIWSIPDVALRGIPNWPDIV